VQLTPLAIAADACGAWQSADTFGVVHDPRRDVPALGPQELEELAGRQPLNNTAMGGNAASAARSMGNHRKEWAQPKRWRRRTARDAARSLVVHHSDYSLRAAR
jgi:hypothetical protein